MLPNKVYFKIRNLTYFTCYRWYYDRGIVDWGTTINLTLKSNSGIIYFGPLFKFILPEE